MSEYVLDTKRALKNHIVDLLTYDQGETPDEEIIESLAYQVWGNYIVGDTIEMPADLAQLYQEAHSALNENTY